MTNSNSFMFGRKPERKKKIESMCLSVMIHDLWIGHMLTNAYLLMTP